MTVIRFWSRPFCCVPERQTLMHQFLFVALRGTVVGLVSSGHAAVLFDEPGVGWHDHHVQLQLAASQLLQVPDRVPRAHSTAC